MRGRPKEHSDEVVEQARRLLATGMSVRRVASLLGISKSAVGRMGLPEVGSRADK